MADGTFKDHFSGVSAGYAAYRPTYPIGLVDDLANISPGSARALDCACGTGQLSVLLAERFAEVVATDASVAQIEAARPGQGVIYRAAPAEDSGLPDASVDLITVAQAAHWLDLDGFYAEARRVGRPGAALALVAYGVLHIEDARTDRLIQHFYRETVGPYWPAERRHVHDGYRSLPFPFVEARLPERAMEVRWRLEDLVGYIGTWSAVKAAREALGSDPVGPFADALREEWGDPVSRRRVAWPLSIRAGHVEG
jgi:SAM-dependent methyltransferase